ncbi:MAG: rsbP [Bacteroidetes bacterium]|jgi:serine phosphatase RsbU (regulator of sigma subunit)|nr:rsbP [Bacteroidota bacterium]
MGTSKRYYILFCLLFTLFSGIAQDYKLIDSLRRIIPAMSDDDTMKCRNLNSLAFEYSYIDLDSGMRIALKALEIAEKTNHLPSKANVYNTMGTIYHDEGNFQKAVECYTTSRKYAEETNDGQMMAVVYANMGNTYESIGDYANAKHYMFESFRIFRERKDTKRFAGSYLNIGILYSEDGDLDSAMYFFNEALKYPIKNKGILANLHSSMATCLRRQNKLKEAEQELLIALAIVREMRSEYYEASYSNELANIYIEQGKYDEAEKLARKSLAYAKQDKLLRVETDANYNLYKLSMGRKQFQKALEYHLEYTRLNDSINNKDRNNAARELEKKYQTEKKQAEIEKLHSEKEASNRLLTYAVIGGALILCALGFAVFAFIKKRKANAELQILHKEVSAQKNELQDKNKSITDSIQYAQRIQNVLLTSQNYIRENIPEFFILNKPKDIVSGDFYWAIRQDNSFYFQVADCTGHGVPGAFMSLLGISFLNEIMLERNIERPNEILDHLRGEIIKVFTDKDNHNNQMNDGMDCVLCRFDFHSNTLQYAAANNSISIIRNGEIIHLTGDKMPVGKSPRDQDPFSLNIFQLQKGDCLYMFSDGYPDQFGGNAGKKLKAKNVKQLLLSVSDKPMAEQQTILNDHFEKWRGNLEQIDDVLMVGIRI